MVIFCLNLKKTSLPEFAFQAGVRLNLSTYFINKFYVLLRLVPQLFTDKTDILNVTKLVG